MRIESSVVDYSVQHAYSEKHQVFDEVRAEPVRDRVEVSSGRASGAGVPHDEESEANGDSRATLAKLVIRVLMGGRFDGRGRGVHVRHRGGDDAPRAERRREGPRWSVEVRHREVHEEKESLVVGAKGAIKTADGREFQFDAAFSLQKSYRVESGSSIEFGSGGEPKDPLFLDRDGLSRLLVRDANDDGKLTNLGEVFGANTGDGFAELAAFDADGNGWIDEGDPVFGELRLRLDDGSLVELGALGIGALSTSGAEGEFQYKNDDELVATVRKTGIYLNENGTAGALRQVDLVM